MTVIKAGLFRHLGSIALAALISSSLVSGDAASADDTPAKQLFGTVQLPSNSAPSPIGFYAKGCMAGSCGDPDGWAYLAGDAPVAKPTLGQSGDDRAS